MKPKNLSLLLLWCAMLAAILLTTLFSLSVGEYEIPFSHILAAISQALGMPFGAAQVLPSEEMAVLWHIRLPRTLVGLLVGASLGASGAVMQGIFSNPLADPGIIGVSSGAAVGAVAAIAGGFTAVSLYTLPLCAFLGALLSVGITVALSMRHGRIPVMTLLLSGVVVGMLLAAVTAAILTVVNEQKLQQYLFWTIGGLDYRRWEHVQLGLVPIGAGILFLLFMARQLNVLVLGEVEARAVGMPVTTYRFLLLLAAAMTTAAGVSISGNIGFVGLVVPHAMRFLTGPDHRRLLPASVAAGGIFLVFCDTLGRVIVPGVEVRVGIMTAFIGTPYFLYLLRRSRNTFTID